jgi:putative GTP pyrophosphokinase
MPRTASFQPEKHPKSFSAGFDAERLWKENPEAIKRFIDRQADYEKLCAEVAYILNRELNKAEIEFSTITYRAKSLNSFLEKIQRKSYADPLKEITDFAGVRVVCLYHDDLERLERVIGEYFELVEKIDKLTDRKADQFGYGAIHFVVRLGENASGARYDDLKSLVCEIQTRTVLQDAWAIIDQHLVYKNESNIPTVLRSRLNLLAGNFRRADEEFSSIRAEREDYLREVTDSETDSAQFLENELNLDSFVRYAHWKFPELAIGTNVLDIPFYLKPLTEMKLRTLRELDAIIERASRVYRLYLEKNGRDFLNSYAITSVVLAALLVNPEFIPEHLKSVFPKFAEFIESEDFKETRR